MKAQEKPMLETLTETLAALKTGWKLEKVSPTTYIKDIKPKPPEVAPSIIRAGLCFRARIGTGKYWYANTPEEALNIALNHIKPGERMEVGDEKAKPGYSAQYYEMIDKLWMALSVGSWKTPREGWKVDPWGYFFEANPEVGKVVKEVNEAEGYELSWSQCGIAVAKLLQPIPSKGSYDAREEEQAKADAQDTKEEVAGRYNNPFAVCVLRLARITERGEEAVMHWDDSTVGKVDDVLNKVAHQLGDELSRLPEVTKLQPPEEEEKRGETRSPRGGWSVGQIISTRQDPNIHGGDNR